ncbi:HEAT repeat domain-containing protein [Aureliella helgolandensis]|uniref:Putative lyase n=1 Tax=Aureliella helgolandensis TaxID=2527968 RepID=A0A518GA19_9BACT|nr:HEAT repeat domain-containing protein [Aureliella helgolandensis]QDV25410.1 putative lyase [Aureliella helgolandensis]
MSATWPAVLVLFLISLPSIIEAGQTEDASISELVAQLASDELEVQRDAAYELARRQNSTPEVIQALGVATLASDTQVRFQALMTLARIGAPAHAVTPQLIQCLSDRDDQIRYRAGTALGCIGAAAVPALAEAWTEASNDAKLAIAQAASRIGPDSQTLAAVFTEELDKTEDAELARFTAEALAAITPSNEALFVQMCGHPVSGVRRVGAEALSALPSASAAAHAALLQTVSDADPVLREWAAIALAKSSLPAEQKYEPVERLLLDSNASVRAAAVVAMRKSNLLTEVFAKRLIDHLATIDGEYADGLVDAICEIGNRSTAALPALVKYAQQPAVDASHLSKSLARFGGVAVAPLLDAIEDHPNLEMLFSSALAFIGAPAIPTLLEHATNENELVRIASVRALGEMQPAQIESVPPLTRAIEDPSASVRSVAVALLLAQPFDLSAAQDTLVNATTDDAEDVRAAAMGVIHACDLSSEERQALIVRGLHDGSPKVRTSVLLAVRELPQELTKSTTEIIALLEDDLASVRAAAVGTLAYQPQQQVHEGTVAALVEALNDPATEVRLAATTTIQLLHLVDPALLVALGDNLTASPELLISTLEAIKLSGKEGSQLASAVAELIFHEEQTVRVTAIQTLGQINDHPQQQCELLVKALEDPEWEVRQAAAVGLGEKGTLAEVAVPKLFTMLSNEEDSDFASRALREINTAPLTSIPLFIENLDSEDRRVGYYAVTLLGKIGPPARAAIPKLEEMQETLKKGDRRGGFRRDYLQDAIDAIHGRETPE